MSTTAAAGDLPAHVQLIQIGTAYWGSEMLLTAARLGIADQLAAGPRSASDLAAELDLHAPSLYRFMRTLAGMGLLTEVEPQRFALTPLGEALKKDAPGAARSTILVLAGMGADLWRKLAHSVKTGESANQLVFGKPLFEHIAERPELASHFSETMVGFHGREPAAVAAAYDFDAFGSVVDVGGATGNMLIHILERHGKPRGVLFDLPHVVNDAPAFLAAHGMTERVSIESGSFFESVPVGHDAYVLSHIIHDWDPAQCQTILTNVRRAIAPGGKLLIVEMVLPEGDTPHHGKLLDMMMLVGTGGQERTPDEYRELLATAGFRMTRVVPTESDVSIVEAVVA